MSEEKWTPAWRNWSNDEAEYFAYLAGRDLNEYNRERIGQGLEPRTKKWQDAVRRNVEGWKAEKEREAYEERAGLKVIPLERRMAPRAVERYRKGENLFNVGAQAVLDLGTLPHREIGQAIYAIANSQMDEEPIQLRDDNPNGTFADPFQAIASYLMLPELQGLNFSAKVAGGAAKVLPKAAPAAVRGAATTAAGAAAGGAETYAGERLFNGEYLPPESAEEMGKFAAGAGVAVPVIGMGLKGLGKTGTRLKYHYKPNQIEQGGLDNRTIGGKDAGKYQTVLLENGSLGDKLGVIHSLSREGAWGQRLSKLYQANDKALTGNLRNSNKFRDLWQRLTGEAELPTPQAGDTLEMAVSRKLNTIDAWVEQQTKLADQAEAAGKKATAQRIREQVAPVKELLDGAFDTMFDEGIGILSADGILKMVDNRIGTLASLSGANSTNVTYTNTQRGSRAAKNILDEVSNTMQVRDWNIPGGGTGRFFPVSEWRGLLTAATDGELGKVSPNVSKSAYSGKKLGAKTLRETRNRVDREIAKGPIKEGTEVATNEYGEIVRPGSSPMDDLANQTAYREKLLGAAKSKQAAIDNNQNFARTKLLDVLIKAPLKASKAFDYTMQGLYDVGNLLVPKSAEEMAARRLLALPEDKGGKFGASAVTAADIINRSFENYEDADTPTAKAARNIDSFLKGIYSKGEAK